MKNILFILFLSLSIPAFAGINDIKSANNQIGVSLVATHVDYKETFDSSYDGLTDSEKGWVPGFSLSASAMKDVLFGNDYFEASFTRLNGNTDYKSSSSEAPTCLYCGGTITQNHGAQITDIHARYGRGFILNNEWMITPYAEIGHHEWKRNLGLQIPVGTPYGNSVSEEYNHSYFSLGSLAQYSPTKDLVFTLNGSIGSTFMASISGKGFGDVPGVCGAYCGAGPFGPQDLGSDLTYKLSLSADYAFTKNIHANAGINYTEFRYGKSDLFNTFNFEPDSKTSYATVNVGLGYAF